MKDKVIFDDIEQFNKLWSDLTGCDALPSTIIKVKEKGYIRKSAVEVAEEMYSKVVEYKGCLKWDELTDAIDKIYKGFCQLKAENESRRNE